MSEELINPDLKERACRIIAKSINDAMENAVKSYESGEWFSYKTYLNDLRELFDIFRDYCVTEIVVE